MVEPMAAPTETGSTDCIEPPGLKKSLKDKTSQRPLCHQSAQCHSSMKKYVKKIYLPEIPQSYN